MALILQHQVKRDVSCTLWNYTSPLSTALGSLQEQAPGFLQPLTSQLEHFPKKLLQIKPD